MKREITYYLRLRLQTMHAGPSAETGPGQCAVCKDSAEQKQGNEEMVSLSICHRDSTIRLIISCVLSEETIPQSDMIIQQNSILSILDNTRRIRIGFESTCSFPFSSE